MATQTGSDESAGGCSPPDCEDDYGPPAADGNPLLNKVILENLFHYPNFKDLAAARRICKLWYESCLPAWRASAPRQLIQLQKTLMNHRNHYGFWSWCLDPGDSDTTTLLRGWEVSEFLQTVHGPPSSPPPSYEFRGLRKFRKFAISTRSSSADDDEKDIISSFGSFFTTCGEWITDLEVELVVPNKGEDWHSARDLLLLSKLTPSLVKLKVKLIITGDEVVVHQPCSDFVKEPHKKLKFLQISVPPPPPPPGSAPEIFGEVDDWIQLFKRYPNIKTLIRGFKGSEEEAGVGQMLEAVRRVRQEDRKSLDLKHFEIHCSKDDEIWSSEEGTQLLLAIFRLTPPLRLESFAIRVGTLPTTWSSSAESRRSGGDFHSKTIDEILKCQAPSLKRLSIARAAPLWNHTEFPVTAMPSVQELELGHCPIRRLTFLRGFPNLQTFVSRRDGYNDEIRDEYRPVFSSILEAELGGLILPSLTKFVCFEDTSNDFTPEDLQRLGTVMPNLKHLRLWLGDNECFQMVCGCWPHLEELHIEGNGVHEDVFTGLVDGELQRNPQNITVFRDLKSLSFDMSHLGLLAMTRGDADLIADKVVYEGILQLPALKKLHIEIEFGMKHVERVLRERIEEVNVVVYHHSDDFLFNDGPCMHEDDEYD